MEQTSDITLLKSKFCSILSQSEIDVQLYGKNWFTQHLYSSLIGWYFGYVLYIINAISSIGRNIIIFSNEKIHNTYFYLIECLVNIWKHGKNKWFAQSKPLLNIWLRFYHDFHGLKQSYLYFMSKIIDEIR